MTAMAVDVFSFFLIADDSFQDVIGLHALVSETSQFVVLVGTRSVERNSVMLQAAVASMYLF